MISAEKASLALKAIHELIIQARFMAYNDQDHRVIAELLDYTELLPCLILEQSDRTKEFREVLAQIADTFPICGAALQRFDENES
jgi:hypothetical protein